MRVLVVDDDPDILALLETWLGKLGHATVRATRGAEAIKAGLHGDIDLLVCDLMLPDLDGTEVIRAIKAQSPHLPVIVVSAFDAEAWQQACLDAGATVFLQKPLRLQRFCHELQLVERARPGLRIALVDPDLLQRRRLGRELAEQGCEIEATERLDVDALDPLRPQLLLVDSDDPELRRACAWAQSRGATLVVLAADPQRVDDDALLRAGAALVLHKPVDAESLLVQMRFMVDA